MDVAGRIPRLLDRLVAPGAATARAGADAVDGLLVTDLVNIRYLTGFTGSAALLLVHPGEVVFVTDGRYRDQSVAQLAASGVSARVEVDNQRQREILADAVRAGGITRLGLEADHVTWAQQGTYASEWFAEVELVATTGLVEDLREIKDPGEVARIAAAAAIADAALAGLRHRLLDGPTEAEFGLELDTEMRRLGASGPSFETIVASGPNAGMPHARPGGRRIGEGDLVVLDFGALVDGYCSDISRTVMVGEPTAEQQRMLDVVAEAQAAGVAAVRAGVPAVDIDGTCRRAIEGHGLGEAFLHATGHGVGLEIHERPRVGPRSDATLAAGNVVTVEPGVYIPEHGGVRIEDTVVVTDDGCRPLTLTPKSTGV